MTGTVVGCQPWCSRTGFDHAECDSVEIEVDLSFGRHLGNGSSDLFIVYASQPAEEEPRVNLCHIAGEDLLLTTDEAFQLAECLIQVAGVATGKITADKYLELSAG